MRQMTDAEYEQELDVLLVKAERFCARAEVEMERAQAIHDLRKREGRTIGAKRRAELVAGHRALTRITAALDSLISSSADEERARFEERLQTR